MNILFVTNWFPTNNDPFKGIFIKEHAKAASYSGADILILHLNISPSRDFYKEYIEVSENEGMKIITLNIHSFLYKAFYISPLFTYFRLLRRVKNKITEFNPDIIHSHVIFPAGIIGNKLSKKYNKPHIITEHWTEIFTYKKKNIFSKNGIIAYRNADYILPVSKFLKGEIINLTGRTENVEVIGNVVDESIFHYKPKENRKKEVITFVAVANWMYRKDKEIHKRGDIIIKALAQVQKKIEKRIQLIMIGDGNWIPYLEELAVQENLNVKFTGFKDKKEISEYLHNSDFFIHATSKETFSVAIAEALKTGTPVIATNVGAIPELVDTNSGILTSNTLDDWTSSISKAMSTNFDNYAIAEKFKGKFNYSTIGDKITATYTNCINQ